VGRLASFNDKRSGIRLCPDPRLSLTKRSTSIVEGEIYPSVTTIIKATVPVELSWWGMEVGVAGVAVLIRRGLFPRPYDPAHVVELLKEQNLTTNSIFWKRGESGTAIHKAFEDYGKTGKIPDLNDFPDEDHNRVAPACRVLTR
jgi:hypothetical protein